MLFFIACEKCKHSAAVKKTDFDIFLDPIGLDKVQELEKQPDVKVIKLELEDGCASCLPSGERPKKGKLSVVRGRKA